MILSGLKTLLETGEDLTTPASLMYLASETAEGDVGPKTERQMADMPQGGGRDRCAPCTDGRSGGPYG